MVSVFNEAVEKSLSMQKEIRFSPHNDCVMYVLKNFQVRCTNPNPKKKMGLYNKIALRRCPHGLRNIDEPPTCQISL